MSRIKPETPPTQKRTGWENFKMSPGGTSKDIRKSVAKLKAKVKKERQMLERIMRLQQFI